MATKKNPDPQDAGKLWEEFLSSVDKETRPHELTPLTVILRQRELYVPAGTKSQMDRDNGSPVVAILTRTDKESGTVQWTAAPSLQTQGARRVRMTDSMGGGYVAFGIPLRKLELTIPEERALTLDVTRIPIPNGKVIYEISFAQFKNTKRDLDEAKRAEKKAIKAQKARERRSARSKPSKEVPPEETETKGA